MIESTALLEKEALLMNRQFLELTKKTTTQILKTSKPFQQQLTHQKIIAVFWEMELNNNAKMLHNTFIKIDRKELTSYAFPKIIDRYLQDNSLYLKLY